MRRSRKPEAACAAAATGPGSAPGVGGGAPPFADAVRDSAQQIWQAGLGAFARAQGEGARVFESLAQDGLALQRKSQAAAEERLADVTERMSRLSEGVQARAGPQWDRLESIFEDRVARALARLQVPSAADLLALTERIDALNAQIDRLTRTTEVGRVEPAPRRPRGTSAAQVPSKTPAAQAAPTRPTTPARKRGA